MESQDKLKEVRKMLAEQEAGFARSARRWKTGYRTLLVCSAVFSSAAALVGQFAHLKFAASNDIAAILAAMAASITTLIAALDFESNWAVNRKSRHLVKVLVLEAEKSTAKADELLAALQEIVKQRMDALNKHD